MTRIPKSGVWNDRSHAVYDVRNRVAEVRAADDSTVVAQYQYDGENRRAVKKTYVSGQLSETRHFYYGGLSRFSSDENGTVPFWQVLEERVGEATTAERQNVWGDRYIDDLVLRDRDTDANGSLDERLYAMQDPNWNMIAVANTSGAVQERYSYSAYGTPTFMTSAFAGRNPNSSSYAWDSLYTGRQYDPETGLYQYRMRSYGAELGRFTSRDPLESLPDLYSYCGSNSFIYVDPFGLKQIQGMEIGQEYCGCQQRLRAEIGWAGKMQREYRACGQARDAGGNPKYVRADEIEKCIEDSLARQGITTTAAGTTDASGNSEVNPAGGKCGPLLDKGTGIHEGIHRKQQEKDFVGFFLADKRWRNEVAAYGSEIPFYDAVIDELDKICRPCKAK